MKKNSYRINADLLAICHVGDSKRQGVTIPSGATITLMGGPTNRGRLVEADWNGEVVLMFADDIRKHGTRI